MPSEAARRPPGSLVHRFAVCHVTHLLFCLSFPTAAHADLPSACDRTVAVALHSSLLLEESFLLSAFARRLHFCTMLLVSLCAQLAQIPTVARTGPDPPSHVVPALCWLHTMAHCCTISHTMTSTFSTRARCCWLQFC